MSSNNVHTAARPALLSLVEEHVANLVQDAVSIQRQAKRARLHERSVLRRLHAADINLALAMRGSERLYATHIIPPQRNDEDDDDNDDSIDLKEFLQLDTRPEPPSEVGLRVHWLAVDGVGSTTAAAPAAPLPDTSHEPNFWVQQLQAALLSEELQLYFHRLCLAMERDDAKEQEQVLSRAASDLGLQELVPFLVRYVQQELSQSPRPHVLIRLLRSLLKNPHLHLELYLHQVLPSLVSCVVQSDAPWTLRRQAADALVLVCRLYGSDYPTLQPRVLQALCQGLSNPRPYGVVLALSLFGAKAVDAFFLPLLSHYWQTHKADANCQRAALEAVGAYLKAPSRNTSYASLEEPLGDALVAWGPCETVYASCFV